jgi:hypothetical protein
MNVELDEGLLSAGDLDVVVGGLYRVWAGTWDRTDLGDVPPNPGALAEPAGLAAAPTKNECVVGAPAE